MACLGFFPNEKSGIMTPMKKNKKKQVLELNYWNSASVIKTRVSNLIQVLQIPCPAWNGKTSAVITAQSADPMLIARSYVARRQLSDHKPSLVLALTESSIMHIDGKVMRASSD